MRSLTSLALATSLLTACATAPSRTVCPTLVSYDQDQLNRAADEADAMPADAFVPIMLMDYRGLRDQVRAVCD